jgi:hypothetical protein
MLIVIEYYFLVLGVFCFIYHYDSPIFSTVRTLLIPQHWRELIYSSVV